MNSFLFRCCLVPLALLALVRGVPGADNLRVPATPLVVHDPYFSIWSFSDKLTDSETNHWTGRPHPLHAMVRVDGQAYRLLGSEPADVPALPQTASSSSATQSRFFFENDQFEVRLIFLTPAIPANLDLLTRPATYLRADVRPKSTFEGKVEFYFDAGAEIAVDTPDQEVQWQSVSVPNSLTACLGTVSQKVLERSGDDLRIDWGWLYLSVPDSDRATTLLKSPSQSQLTVGDGNSLRRAFVEQGNLKTETGLTFPIAVEKGHPVLAWCCDRSGAMDCINPFSLILAYDDLASIRYFDDDLVCWWKRNGMTAPDMLAQAWKDYLPETDDQGVHEATVEDQCTNFDAVMESDLSRVGGEDYVSICALVWRQIFGAQKIVAGPDGRPLMFSKENFSNGSIGTVDVMYPCCPILLYYNPVLMEATLDPIFDYAAGTQWSFPFAPHDLGTYPRATGQTYGGGESSEENQMPVEECGNMILQTAALVLRENRPDYAKKHWDLLSRWAEYLATKGFDPENQLCTDDFAGHMAHNVNLSAKAILALGAYAKMAELLDEEEQATRFRTMAVDFAQRWVQESAEDDHYRLAFDQPGTWSIKYNLIWDRVLQLNLFPSEVARQEIAWYKTRMEPFGLPLDSRSRYGKVDWILWAAALTENPQDFQCMIKPVLRYIEETPDRCPLNDWYWTDSGKVITMRARSVVGGFWAPMLLNDSDSSQVRDAGMRNEK